MEVDSRWKLFAKGFGWSGAMFAIITGIAALILTKLNNLEVIEPTTGIPWGTGLTLLVIWPLIYMCAEHGRQDFVEKHRQKHFRVIDLEEQKEQFKKIFGGENIVTVMETLRDKRLACLAEIEVIAKNKPAQMDEKAANDYQLAIRQALKVVTDAESAIKNARHLAAVSFQLNMPDDSYYLAPKPVESSVLHGVTG